VDDHKDLPALGFVEVRGLANAIQVADAMIKGSSVHLRAPQRVDPALVTIVVEGDVGACEAAVDAGVRVATTQGSLVSFLVKGRPDPSLRLMAPAHDPASARSESSPVQRTPRARGAKTRARR